jgi:hypothetical protein
MSLGQQTSMEVGAMTGMWVASDILLPIAAIPGYGFAVYAVGVTVGGVAGGIYAYTLGNALGDGPAAIMAGAVSGVFAGVAGGLTDVEAANAAWWTTGTYGFCSRSISSNPGSSPNPAPSRTLNDSPPPNPKKPNQANPHAPDPAATGYHTVLGTRTEPKQSPAPYRTGISYDGEGNPLGKTDVTDLGRFDHPNPHYHPYDPTIKNRFDPNNSGNFGPPMPIPDWDMFLPEKAE